MDDIPYGFYQKFGVRSRPYAVVSWVDEIMPTAGESGLEQSEKVWKGLEGAFFRLDDFP
jgi:hypothetical protein